jgi:hypothetical protein
MVAAAGAGPAPIPQRKITAETLSQAISYCLSSSAVTAAAAIAQKMQDERGVEAAVRSFHRNLPVKDMCCDILPHLPATFRFSKGKEKTKLSSVVTEILIEQAPKDVKHLKLYALHPSRQLCRTWPCSKSLTSI